VTTDSTKLLLVVLAVVAGTFAIWTLIGPPKPITVIKMRTAHAWIRVTPDRQQELVQQLQKFSRGNGLTINVSKPPSPRWQMTGIILVTPMHNEIQVINATAPDKFAVSITILHPEDNWQGYWNALRAALIRQYEWKDDP
jgi:hypothetical protein